MAEADTLQRQLLKAQNRDGGWGYQAGTSWTEPTAFALLALQAQNNYITSAYERGCLWLEQNQRPDGGWPPNASVPVSTWVTSLAVLTLSGSSFAPDRQRRAIHWLVGQIEAEMSPVERMVFRIRGIAPPVQNGGSPWFPHTAAWIGPTVFSVLALARAARTNDDPDLTSHVGDAQRYILYQRCRDGGWNHGGSRYLSENAASYPEMTGMALLALYGVPASELNISLKLAKAYLSSPGSIEAFSWLQLALTRHGCDVSDLRTSLPCRTTRDISLRLLALAAASPNNRLLGTI